VDLHEVTGPDDPSQNSLSSVTVVIERFPSLTTASSHLQHFGEIRQFLRKGPISELVLCGRILRIRRSTDAYCLP
ncbi:MAG: hypothetical protein KDA91_25710, partial [Planctomycetaceae bacterium]|nr:hypothetical protein [Planctomycetaceae bacterium]